MYVQPFKTFIENKKEKEILEKVYSEWLAEFGDIQNMFEQESLFMEIVDTIFEDEEINYDELTPGERRAAARDLQIISRPQLAALFLRAKGADEENPDKFMKLILAPEENSGNILDFADEKGHWTNAAFADAIGLLSDYTVSRTVGKFKNMLSGTGHTEQDVLYPKVIKAYEEFKDMDLNEVGSIAGESLQKSDNTTARDKASARSAVSVEQRASAKQDLENASRAIYQIAHQLKKAFPGKSQEAVTKMAVEKIAREKNIKFEKLLKAYEKFKKAFDL